MTTAIWLIVAAGFSTITGCSPEAAKEAEQTIVGVADWLNPAAGRTVRQLSPGFGMVADLDTSAQRERMLADELAVDIERRNRASRDDALVFYVTTVQSRLVAVLDDPPYTFSIRVIDSRDINAFTTGAGNNFITTGMLAALRNEAELAMVLGHEIAHSLEQHVVRGIRNDSAVRALGGTSVNFLEGSGRAASVPRDLRNRAYDYTMAAARNGFSRQDERDADRIGLELMVEAGYAPEAAAGVYDLLARIATRESRIENFFHGAHPLATARAAYIRELVAEHYTDAPAPRGYGDNAYLMATASLR